MSSRRRARREALTLLYQWDLTGQPLASLYPSEVDPFALDLAQAVTRRAEELDALITGASTGWPAERLGHVERAILRMGAIEIVDRRVPVQVAINEAVELAKRYASEEAASLVNGVLARIAREREPSPAPEGSG